MCVREREREKGMRTECVCEREREREGDEGGVCVCERGGGVEKMERKRAVCRQVTKVKNKVPWRWWFQSSLSSAFTSTSSFRVFHSQVKTAQLGLTCPRHKLHARATHIHTHTTHTQTHTHTHTHSHSQKFKDCVPSFVVTLPSLQVSLQVFHSCDKSFDLDPT